MSVSSHLSESSSSIVKTSAGCGVGPSVSQSEKATAFNLTGRSRTRGVAGRGLQWAKVPHSPIGDDQDRRRSEGGVCGRRLAVIQRGVVERRRKEDVRVGPEDQRNSVRCRSIQPRTRLLEVAAHGLPRAVL
jgi:hypothetical protein